MANRMRRRIARSALAIASTLLWGVVELIALQRSHARERNGRAGAR